MAFLKIKIYSYQIIRNHRICTHL